jgi:uncharacterized membrane protein
MHMRIHLEMGFRCREKGIIISAMFGLSFGYTPTGRLVSPVMTKRVYHDIIACVLLILFERRWKRSFSKCWLVYDS